MDQGKSFFPLPTFLRCSLCALCALCGNSISEFGFKVGSVAVPGHCHSRQPGGVRFYPTRRAVRILQRPGTGALRLSRPVIAARCPCHNFQNRFGKDSRAGCSPAGSPEALTSPLIPTHEPPFRNAAFRRQRRGGTGCCRLKPAFRFRGANRGLWAVESLPSRRERRGKYAPAECAWVG